METASERLWWQIQSPTRAQWLCREGDAWWYVSNDEAPLEILEKADSGISFNVPSELKEVFPQSKQMAVSFESTEPKNLAFNEETFPLLRVPSNPPPSGGWNRHIAVTKNRLNAVSPSFCLAKWLQVTLHLQNGFNHSCHHPGVHQASLEEIKNNPSALHNTAFKKTLREMMLRGERPKECSYCWAVEDTPGAHFSDRVIKSADAWAEPRFQEIASAPASKDVNPSYLEVSFGHECNFRCAYCLPYVSSPIWEEFEKHGPFVDRISTEQLRQEGLEPWPKGTPNPYVEAFWKWFPTMAHDLKIFRITGGEPLINTNTFQVLDFLDKNPQPHLELCINSNLGIPKIKFDEFIEKTNRLTKDKKIGKFMLYTSIDTHGPQAEYIRDGLKYEYWLKNIHTYLDETPWPVTFMVTFNLLSISKFSKMLADILDINSKFQQPYGEAGLTRNRTIMDISYLTSPEYMSVFASSKEWREKIGDSLVFMEANSEKEIGCAGFTSYEIHKLQRIFSLSMEAPMESARIRHNRASFFLFTEQYRDRRKKDFKEIFPEYREFYDLCKEEFSKRVRDSFTLK